MDTLLKVQKILCTIFKTIMAILLFTMVALATLQVVTRYFVAVTIIWVEELSIYIMTWMCAIGIAWVWLEDNTHIRMDIMDNLVSRKTIRYMDAGIDAFTAVMSIAAIRIGIRTWKVNHGLVMSVINLDEGDRYIPVIVGGVLLLIASVIMLIKHIHIIRTTGENGTEENKAGADGKETAK